MKRTLSELVQEDIKNKILLNHFLPGELLGEVELSRQYHVSRTPVRQALQHLSSMGLVVIRDGSGSFVTEVSRQQMNDAYQIRCEMEKLALRTAIDKIEQAELDPLERSFREQLALLQRGEEPPRDELAFSDWKLHDLIVEKSDNSLIGTTAEKITLILRRYQIANVSGYERATREHLEIVEGIRKRDLAGVSEILDEHLRLRPI